MFSNLLSLSNLLNPSIRKALSFGLVVVEMFSFGICFLIQCFLAVIGSSELAGRSKSAFRIVSTNFCWSWTAQIQRTEKHMYSNASSRVLNSRVLVSACTIEHIYFIQRWLLNIFCCQTKRRIRKLLGSDRTKWDTHLSDSYMSGAWRILLRAFSLFRIVLCCLSGQLSISPSHFV